MTYLAIKVVVEFAFVLEVVIRVLIDNSKSAQRLIQPRECNI
jgi:hypothetical protein